MIKSHQHLDLGETPIIERATLAPPFALNNDMTHDACFMCSLQGDSILYGPQGSENLTASEAVVMKCGNFVQHFLKGENPQDNEVVVIHFYPKVLKNIFKDEFPEILKTPKNEGRVLIKKIEMDTLLKNYIESLLFYFDNPSVVNDELIRLKLKELLLLLSKTEQAEDIRRLLSDLFNPAEYSFKQIIENNLYENLNLDQLAQLTLMSTSTFKRKFKETFGDAPARYIKTKKLEKAAQLLKHSDQRISDVCFESGFNDLSAFSKSFQQHFGSSPTEYRAQS